MVAHVPHFIDRMNEEINVAGLGLEVAPYFDPTLLKEQYNVLYTDYIDNETIAQKAKENPGSVNDEFYQVDFVWHPGRPLRHCAPQGAVFDYVVASHVMEHVPNPVGWLNDILEVLRPGGKIVLFLPNKDVTFDRYRNVTRFADLVTLWIEQPSVPTPGQIMDFMSNSVHPEKPHDASRSDQCYRDEDAVSTAGFVYHVDTYIDAHCTVWDPETFVATFQRLVDCGIMNVEVSEPLTCDYEFMVCLTKKGEPARKPPQKMERTLSQPVAHVAAVAPDAIPADGAGLAAHWATVQSQIAGLRADIARLDYKQTHDFGHVTDQLQQTGEKICSLRADVARLDEKQTHDFGHVTDQLQQTGEKIYSVKLLLDQVAKRLFVSQPAKD